jgi:glycosyltransferase involved in cell wall biosynthesis
VRIALVSLHFAEYASRLALALAQGHSVLLILRTDNAKSELSVTLLEALEKNVKLALIEHRQLRQLGVVAATRSLIDEVTHFNPDVVHFQEYLADYAAWGAVWLSSKYPFVLTVHDHQPHSGKDSVLPRRKRWYRDLIRRRAVALIVHGEIIADWMRTYAARPGQRVYAIPHGVLGSSGSGESPVQDDGATFLFFGRIEAYKGLGILVAACEYLQTQGRRFRVIVAGSGSDLDQFRLRIAALPCMELREGYVAADALATLFGEASAVLLPYLDATQSGVCAIAYAWGRPVIASRTGALPEVVHDGECGLLVTPGSCNELARAMARLLDDAALRRHLCEGARVMANGELSWLGIAAKTLVAYRTQLGVAGIKV